MFYRTALYIFHTTIIITHLMQRCYWLHSFAIEFIRLEDGLFIPVGPIDVILKCGYREGVAQMVCWVQDLTTLRTIKIRWRYDI